MKRIASRLALVRTARRAARPALALSLLLSLFVGTVRADIKTLCENGKVTWGTENNPQVIYLLDGAVCTQDDAYDEIVLKFTGTEAPGTLTIASGAKVSTRALVVGGGGAGGTSTSTTAGAGGGGGAGGFIDQTQTIGAGTYTITVGAGGPAATTLDTAQGADGSDSSFVGGTVSLVAKGGGGGGAQSVGRPGGSGGGGSYASGTCLGGSGTSDQGNAGGKGATKQFGGGGGGAGGSGKNTTTTAGPGAGGIGLTSDIVLDENGDAMYYAGGGGGGSMTSKQSAKSKGGGGAGAKNGDTEAGSGDDGFGGGGGGGGNACAGGKGGNGVVILRIRDVLIMPPGDVELEWDGENQVGYEPKSFYEIVDVSGDATNATVAGTYQYHVKPADGFMWADGQWTTSDTETKTIEWKIVPMQVDIPVSVLITYDGESHEVASSDEICEIVDGTAVATNAGEYSFTMHLRDAANTIWSDDTTTDKTTPWSIKAKAVSKPSSVGELIYSGTNSVVFTEYDGVKYVSGDTNTVNAGSFNYTVKLDNPAGYTNYVWSGESGDASVANVTVEWSVAAKLVPVPEAKTGLVYNGGAQNAFEGLDWSVYELASGTTNETFGGTYEAVFHLTGNGEATNYKWETLPNTTLDQTVPWSIAAAENEISSLSITGWRIGDTPNTPSLTAKFGAATAVYSYGFGDDVESVTEWLDDATAIGTAGTWILRAIIPETSSWSAVTGTTTFVMWDDPAMLFHNHVEITVKGSTAELTNFVVPVRISESGMRGFYYKDANPTNLVFIDKSDNLLPFDVDTWDESGESVVWVKIATLPTTGTSFTFYWNLREGQIVPENTPTDVWSDYVGVWHMSETNNVSGANQGAVTVKDSSGHQNGTGHASSVVAYGMFGKARGRVVTAGNQGYAVTVPAYSELNNLSAGAFMVSGWVKITDLTKVYQAYLFARKNTDTGGSEGWGARFTGANNANELRFWTSGTGGSYYTMSTTGRFAANTWARYDYVVQSGKPLKLYINGALVASSGNINTVVNGSRPFTIGGMGATTQNSTLNGYSDEVRLRVGHMSDAQIAADYKYQTDLTMVTSDVVYKDGLKVDYWVVEPDMDKTQWDVTDTEKGQFTSLGQLRYGEVTNYIYSVYDESEVYSSISEITKGGTYRAFFARVPTEGFLPLEKVIEFRITQSKPYTKIGGTNGNSGRILLMNRDTNTKLPTTDRCPIDRQGYSDIATTQSTFWQRFDTDESDLLFNLKATTNSVLWTRGYGERLWHLDNCRHGNTFPKDVASGSLVQIQNYLPYSSTSYSIDQRTTLAKQNTAGQVVMRNIENAAVYSPCYTNGIGTIYFDAVNGWTGINDYNNIVVEIATNTVEGLPPTDANCMTVTTNVVDMTEVITTNWYGNLEGCWNACTMRPFVMTNGVGFFETNSTKELSLQMDIGGRADCFYRVVVPVDYQDAIRFRIRRVTFDKNWHVDVRVLILLDNIIASPPAMGGDLRPLGHYDGTKSGKRQLGWELATSVPYPSITDDEVFGGAMPTYYVNYGDGTEPNTNDFFHSAKMYYRWSYLSQVTNDWSAIVLNPADDFRATSAFEIPAHECDVEYWYEYITQAPYYSYVDYSGINKLFNYTEERGVQTNTCPLATIMASGSTNWFFRVRDGKSDYAGLDIVFKREGSDAERREHMMLVGDHVWRGFIQTPTNMEGKISWRIEALDRQTEPYAEYAASTNHYYCTTGDLALPVSDKLDAGSAESWSTLDFDALTGYVMFQVDDQSQGLTVVHADYQNFNVWSDAKGSVFVGNSTSDDSKSGTSSKKQTFTQNFDTWKAMPVTITNWQFASFSDIQYSHMHDRLAYTPFESDDDGLWECGPGMWVAKEYKNDANNRGVALQMEGQGKGNLRINDVDYAPRGVESVTFNARLGQFIQFRDFNYYNGERHLSMTNYTFMTRVAFDRNSNKDFKGNASLSIVADYLQNKGCYEARWEYIGTSFAKNLSGNKGQRLCLYRWNVTSTGVKETLLTAWTNTISNFNIPAATSLNSNFMPFYITVSNDTANACTWVAAGVCRTSISLGSEWDVASGPNKAGSNWYIVACRDASDSRLVRGTYGVVSANCDGVFGRPQYSTQTMLTAADELKLAANKAGYYSNKTRTLPTGSGNIFDKTADFGTEDTEWNILPGRMKTENGGSSQKSAIVADPAPQTLSIYSCTAGKSDWGKTALTNITVSIFGNKTFTLPLYTTKNCGLKFTVGGLGEENRTDIVIDTVSIRQFRGDNYSDMDEMLPLIPDWTNPYSVDPGWGLTNWVFTSAWITNKTTKVGSNVTTNGMLLLSARRTKPGDVSSIRSPLMDGYEYTGGVKRGTGLGMISYDYEDAQSNAVLLVQIATNNVRSSLLANWDTDDDELWTTVATNDFSKLTATERAKGTISTYIGLHGITGLVRIVVDPKLVDKVAGVTDTSAFGEVKISKVVCRDEPALDSACWWGWNLRMVGTVGISDVEGKMYLPDYATDAEDVGMSLALNNSITEDIDKEDADAYKEHVPFVQTPTFASEVVGEVSFKARRYDVSDEQPASVTLYGSVSGAEDSTWTVLTNITVESSVYRTYTYKANMSSRYAAFRLGVSGVPGVKDSGSVPTGYDTPVRVLIDEVFVSEAVYARMAFRNVGTIRNRDQDEALNRSTWVAGVPGKIWQPLCAEGWGVQCEVYTAQLSKEIDTSFQPEVVLHWFEGKEPWGFSHWKDKTKAEGHHAEALSLASDTNSFYRSSYESSPNAVVPMSLKPGTVVQYMLEVRYRQIGSDETHADYLTPADWTRPDWYRPVDFNAELGGGTKEGFSAYCILDTVAPGWAWINEVNLFGKFDDSWNNTEENCQFVEIAAPVEADLTDWKLLFYGGSVEGGGLVTTNVAAVFGTSELPGTKPGAVGAASNMVFRVIASPKSTGVLKKSDGTLDATWDFSTSYTDTFTRNGSIYALHPFGIQLVRPTGIVEHEIVCIGTNYFGSISGLEQYYDPTNTVAYFKKYLKDCDMFYAGADEAVMNPSGEYRSLGVFESAGETSNQWNNVMKRTPGRINENQMIDPDHPTPNGESIVVFCNVDSELGHVRQTVGDAVETNAAVTVFIRRGSTLGTNIVYTVDPWYELGAVTTNGQPTAFATTGVRKYVANVGAGASNNVTVIATAKIDSKLVNEYGLTDDEPYRNAIMDWLNKGTDLYGNSWADPESGEIKLADLIGLNNQWYTNLSLRAMYWLDMDPTAGNLALKGGMSKAPVPLPRTGESGQPVTDLDLGVFMQITNRATGEAWTPYAIRGLEPGSSSLSYGGNWTSATFKVVGFLNTGKTSWRVRENRVPLRWFVFKPNSFIQPGETGEFTSDIEVIDPFTTESPAFSAGWAEWAAEHGRGQDFYFWDLDDRLVPISVEELKTINEVRKYE